MIYLRSLGRACPSLYEGDEEGLTALEEDLTGISQQGIAEADRYINDLIGLIRDEDTAFEIVTITEPRVGE